MDKFRLYHTLRLCSKWGAGKRAEYLRKQHIFKDIGENCTYMPRVVPLYPNLIKMGDHVAVASGVSFYTHDGIHNILENDLDVIPDSLKDHKFTEGIGCIEIGDHVFIGARVQIAYNVKIGNNVVITAGSIVNNDIPSNSVVRGNPAKVICTLKQYLAIKGNKKSYPPDMGRKMGKYVGKELEEWLWADFYHQRNIRMDK